MAQKRMLDKKISVSEQVANLAPKAQVIFTWSIAHADDVGMLPSSLRTLKATVVPLDEMDMDEFEQHVKSIVKEGLYEKFEYGGLTFYRIVNFARHQTLKKDRQPMTILPIMYHAKPQETWEFLNSVVHLEDNGIQMEDDGIQMEPEEKRREEKRSKGSKIMHSAFAEVYGDPLFQEMWAEYPRKTAKGDAWRAWCKLHPSRELGARIVASVKEHRERDPQWLKDDGKFIPHPATFLNQRRFDDEVQSNRSYRKTTDQF